MKKIFQTLLAFATLFVFAIPANAQEYEYVDNGSGIVYNKSITPPDNNGVYNIVLESFVKGKVTITHEVAPADIILILDYSSSMTQTTDNLTPLKQAVVKFINTIKTSNANVTKDALNVGHRIALVLYAGSVFNQSGNKGPLNQLLDVDNIEASGTSVTYNGEGNILDYRVQNYTNHPVAIQRAQTILSGRANAGDYPENSKRTRVVVLFTDGEPVVQGQQQGSIMSNALTYANQIKTSTTYGATLYTVGLFNGHTTADNITTYMSYLSSDYTNKTSVARPYVNVSGKYSIIVSNASALDNVFDQISGEAADPVPLDGESVTEVDVVSASFALPVDMSDMTQAQIQAWADANITIQTAKCKGEKDGKYKDKDGNIVNGKVLEFYDPVDAPGQTGDLDDNIELKLSASGTLDSDPGKIDVIEVNGFHYGDNFCGPVKDGDQVTDWKGYKLIVTIPIKMDKNAVGGPHMNTNAPGSGIIVNNDKEHPIITFESPKVSLPINLHINKRGLSEGESALFKIERATLPANWTKPASSDNTAYNSLTWTTVTSVLVTRQKGQNSDSPITKVIGLPADDGNYEYVYRIVEDKWSWSYDSLPATETTSELLEINPFIFTNSKKQNGDIDKFIKNAESKATNIFRDTNFPNGKKAGTSYDDSKPRTTSTP